jgi:hypothetical protein
LQDILNDNPSRFEYFRKPDNFKGCVSAIFTSGLPATSNAVVCAFWRGKQQVNAAYFVEDLMRRQ